MEILGFVLAWGSAIWFAATRFSKYGGWGALYLVGAIAFSWLGVLGAFVIHSIAGKNAAAPTPTQVQPQPYKPPEMQLPFSKPVVASASDQTPREIVRVRCPHCKALQEEDASFCNKCGKAMFAEAVHS